MMGFGDPDARSTLSLTPWTVLRWSSAAIAVVAAFVAAGWLVFSRRPVETAAAAAPAIQIDLAPIAVAPPAPPQDVAPGPEQTQAAPEPEVETQTPVDDPEPDPTPPAPEPPQIAESVQPDPPPPPVKIPELPKKEKAVAVLAPPKAPPKRKPRKKTVAKPREAAQEKPVEIDKKRVKQTTAPPRAHAVRAARAAAPAAGSSQASSMSAADWKSEMLSRLNRFKRYPPGATGFGTATISFTISRSGQVLSAHLIGSSGDRALDAEAISLPRRASPMPAPPANLGGGAITLAVPVRFNS